jgi:hypothetical protein
VPERLCSFNPEETSNYITHRKGSADAVQTKLYLIISRTRTALPMQSKRNFITYSNGSADSFQTKPLTTSQTGMSLQMQFKRIAYWNHPSTRCWSIITLGIPHIGDNHTPQITNGEVIKGERVFGDVKWDGL